MTNDQRPTTNDPQPTIVGLTGGIGSGKSTIANELARRGYEVYDCDREAKRIIASNRDVQAQIIHLLGEESFVNGKYNTAYVSRKVFSPSLSGEGRGEALLSQLNAIVHPAVKRDIQQRSGLTVNKVNGLTAKRSNSVSVLTGVAGLLQIVLFLFAALGCYSRLYLSQHFAIDILVGILIGILITMLVYAVFLPLENKKWYNYRLFAKK